METGENKTSEKPEPKFGLPQEGISHCPFFHGPAFLAVCLSNAAGKVAGVLTVRERMVFYRLLPNCL